MEYLAKFKKLTEDNTLKNAIANISKDTWDNAPVENIRDFGLTCASSLEKKAALQIYQLRVYCEKIYSKDPFSKLKNEYYFTYLMAYILKNKRCINWTMGRRGRLRLYNLLPADEAYLAAYFTDNFNESEVIKLYGNYNHNNRWSYLRSSSKKNFLSEKLRIFIGHVNNKINDQHLNDYQRYLSDKDYKGFVDEFIKWNYPKLESNIWVKDFLNKHRLNDLMNHKFGD